MTDQTAIVVSTPHYLAPAAGLQNVLMAYQAKKEFIERVLVKGVDFGTIPGTGDKPALLKPGSEKLASFFGLSPVFEDVVTTEDWTGADHNGEPFFYYRQKCKLYQGDWLVATADGSCNSWEKKYRYRNGERVCPKCGKAAIIVGKKEYGGGFICFAKKGGCGAKFGDKAPEIIGQNVGQVVNPDVSEQVNTILKMAQKRALVAAVLIATNASDYFTQDIEDFTNGGEYVDTTARDVTPDPAPVVKVTRPPQPDYDPPMEERIDSFPPGAILHGAPSSLMTLEMASLETSSTGEKYIDMDNAALANRMRGIKQGLGKDGITPEYREELTRKQDAIRVILGSRQ